MSFLKGNLGWNVGQTYAADNTVLSEFGEVCKVRRLRSSIFNNSANTPFASRLHVFKGALPSQADIDGFVYDTDSWNASSLTRSSDLLMLPITSINFTYSTSANTITHPFNLSDPATQSGTMTWFAWEFPGSPGGASLIQGRTTYPNIMIGSIGLAGSGADMIVSDLEVVEGVRYQFPQITIPTVPGIFNF